MKNRILASALALVLASGLAVSAAAEIPSSPITSHKVSKIPVIDGKYDENERCTGKLPLRGTRYRYRLC